MASTCRAPPPHTYTHASIAVQLCGPAYCLIRRVVCRAHVLMSCFCCFLLFFRSTSMVCSIALVASLSCIGSLLWYFRYSACMFYVYVCMYTTCVRTRHRVALHGAHTYRQNTDNHVRGTNPLSVCPVCVSQLSVYERTRGTSHFSKAFVKRDRCACLLVPVVAPCSVSLLRLLRTRCILWMSSVGVCVCVVMLAASLIGHRLQQCTKQRLFNPILLEAT